MLRILPYLTALALLASIAACKHEPVQPVVPPGGNGGTDTVIVNPDPCDPDSVYFNTTIGPLLNASCATTLCHDAVDPADGIRLDSYAAVMAADIIDPGDPLNSDLYDVITDTDPDNIMPEPPNDPLTPEQIFLIYTWIQQGAQNNSCTPDCDPTQFSYSANILPVIDLACQGCHSGGNPSAGLSLTSYSTISSIALNGSLMNSLLGENGAVLMPQGTAGLPQCNIDQIQLWIDNGAPNN